MAKQNKTPTKKTKKKPVNLYTSARISKKLLDKLAVYVTIKEGKHLNSQQLVEYAIKNTMKEK